MLKVVHLVALALAVAVLAACSSRTGYTSPTNTPVTATTQASSTSPVSNTPSSSTPAAVTPSAETDAAVQAVKDDLVGRLAVTANDIQVVSINQRDWPDACLGAGEAKETCAAVITPGYAIVVRVAETSYTYRTDKAGANVRPAGVHINTGSN